MPGGRQNKRNEQFSAPAMAHIEELKRQIEDWGRYAQACKMEVAILQGKLDNAQAYNTQMHYDYQKLENELRAERKQRNELERTHNKTIRGISHNSDAEIIGTLKEDIKRLQQERDEKDKNIAELKSEIDSLQSKLSKFAGTKMTENNPTIADLSDPVRPQKLVEKCSILYDNKWTEAYECSSNKGDEQQICTYLLELFKETWKFCKDNAEKQLKQLEQTLLMIPDNKDNKDTKDLHTPLSLENVKLTKELRKLSAREMLPNLYEKFSSKNPDIKKELRPYVENCLELCWYSTIHDPQVHYGFDAVDQQDDFRKFTQSGKTVSFIVWPAMYLHVNGPILNKGVAQFTD